MIISVQLKDMPVEDAGKLTELVAFSFPNTMDESRGKDYQLPVSHGQNIPPSRNGSIP